MTYTQPACFYRLFSEAPTHDGGYERRAYWIYDFVNRVNRGLNN